MVSCTLQFQHENGGPGAKVVGEFSDSDLDQLRAFSAQMERVEASALVSRGFSGITNMKWGAGSGMDFTAGEYSNAELYELLHVLRPVMLERERTSFYKALALLSRRFADKGFSEYVAYLRHVFEEGVLSGYMQIEVNGQKLLHHSVLKLWLNGVQYHTDEEKAEAWRHLESALSESNARALTIELIHSRVKVLLLFNTIVGIVLSQA